MNWLLRRKFLVLLIAVMLLLVVNPLLRIVGAGQLLFNVLHTLVFVAAVPFPVAAVPLLGVDAPAGTGVGLCQPITQNDWPS